MKCEKTKREVSDLPGVIGPESEGFCPRSFHYVTLRLSLMAHFPTKHFAWEDASLCEALWSCCRGRWVCGPHATGAAYGVAPPCKKVAADHRKLPRLPAPSTAGNKVGVFTLFPVLLRPQPPLLAAGRVGISWVLSLLPLDPPDGPPRGASLLKQVRGPAGDAVSPTGGHGLLLEASAPNPSLFSEVLT